VIFSTGHHAPSQPENQSLHAPLPQLEDATRVVYMPGRDLRLLAQQWLDEGLPPELPCAIVSRAAQPGQQIRTTTLAALGNAAPALAPSLLIAGWALRESYAAFQQLAKITSERNGDSKLSGKSIVPGQYSIRPEKGLFSSRRSLGISDPSIQHGGSAKTSEKCCRDNLR
jgi:hypothetical protein